MSSQAQEDTKLELNSYAVKAHAVYILQAQSPTGSSPGFCLQIFLLAAVAIRLSHQMALQGIPFPTQGLRS